MTDPTATSGSPAIRYDIVGCGAVVEEMHLPVVQQLQQRGEIEVAGCYDHDAKRAERVAALFGAERWGADAAPDAGDRVDAALIATPPRTHAEIAARYVDAGKSVLVEKPFTTTASEARQLTEAAAARGVRVGVNQFWRFNPGVNIARQWLREHRSEVSSIEASEGYRWAWAPASDYVISDPHGGVIHDTGAHVLDMVLYVLGLDGDEQAAGSARVEEVSTIPATEPSHECHALLGFEADGKRIELDLLLSRLRPLASGVKVYGSFGMLLVPSAVSPAPILLKDGEGFRLGAFHAELEPMDWRGCFLGVHEEFVRGVRDANVTTRIDGGRFVLLGELLESLHGRVDR